VCSICNQFTCPTLCPNHREKGIYTCAECGDGISNGECYYRIGSSFFHKECLLDSYDKEELLLLFGAKPRIAEKCTLALLVLGDMNGK